MNTNPDGSMKYHQKEQQWNKQRFCSISCSKMLENPMFDLKTREKMTATQNRQGRRPSVRMGNGQVTELQQLLLTSLNNGWVMEYAIITTDTQRAEGAPHAYKVDLGMPEHKYAIELDGRTHQTFKIRAADKMKVRHLVESGWKVLKLSNSKALSLFTIFK
jgi:very-short-patch-repair endonuclease